MYGMTNRPKAAVEVIQEKLGCWKNATCHCVPDTNVKDWIVHIQSLAFHTGMRECDDERIDEMISGRFPPGHCAVVFDPLTLLVTKQGNNYILKERTPDVEATMAHLFRLLSKFDNALYVCTTYGRRWEVDGNWNVHSTYFRAMANEHGISSWDGDRFWDSIFPWCTREGKTQYLNLWHHGELEGQLNLAHQWGSVLFRIAEFFNFTTLSSDERKANEDAYLRCCAADMLGPSAEEVAKFGKSKDADFNSLLKWFSTCLSSERTAANRIPEEEDMGAETGAAPSGQSVASGSGPAEAPDLPGDGESRHATAKHNGVPAPRIVSSLRSDGSKLEHYLITFKRVVQGDQVSFVETRTLIEEEEADSASPSGEVPSSSSAGETRYRPGMVIGSGVSGELDIPAFRYDCTNADWKRRVYLALNCEIEEGYQLPMCGKQKWHALCLNCTRVYSSYPGFPNNGFCTSCPNPGDTIVALACEALIYVADDVRYYSSDGIMTSVDLDKPSNPRHRVASQIAVETAPQDDDEMEDENPDELPMGSDQGGSFPLSPEISDDIPVEMGGCSL